MPAEKMPPEEEIRARLRARQKSSVLLSCSLLVLVGLAVLVLPLERIPRPMRWFMAAGDFVAASALWLFARQRFGGR
jgi:hypothetical protein